MEVNSKLATGSRNEIAITDPANQDPKADPFTTYFGDAFSSYRILAHVILHEFGHVDYILKGEFYSEFQSSFKKYGSFPGAWNRATDVSEVYAYQFKYNNGGPHYDSDTVHPYYKTYYRNVYHKNPPTTKNK